MTEIERKLLPCPFCGGEADCNNTGVNDKDGNPIWWVECISCGANVEGDNNSEKAATKAWNTRAEQREDAGACDACGDESWGIWDWRRGKHQNIQIFFCPICGRDLRTKPQSGEGG